MAGTALIAGLLKGLLDVGVVPQTNARAVELIGDSSAISGVRIHVDGKDVRVHARRQSGSPPLSQVVQSANRRNQRWRR